jgi:DNA-binding transcriptional LysR family regulator
LTPDVKMIGVASPEYLAHRGVPHSPADLHGHSCINWRLEADGRLYRWEFAKKGKRLEVAVEGPVITNQSHLGVAAALQGLGILYAFDHDVVDEALAKGQLVQVLAGWSIARPGLFLYYPNRRHPQPALSAFIDCLLDRDLPATKRRARRSA